ncbi:DUF1294 domain-containing protein [Marinomonas sp. M1K-6]|uniref:DUF1294 domain-containing protein n=1 Tax=Marinomonas profundi TaxID=2726122 RepID=A0A847RBP6_9GAMM|nr:DUF1294 domain-containing protein [Marinomonas profundi]NLQ18414.1 DUF1294 domain-containing protein [Marinomonas profundi]UDV02468.1 DUF1294 domain-containing protein [Marinomonas profundi]
MPTEYLVLLSFYGLLSLVIFCFYGVDKFAAIRGKQRIRESTLHILSLVGGWPGAMLGQAVFRHKTKKLRFLVVFWLTIMVNLVCLAGVVFLTY